MLFTAEVESLYTNIETEKGLQAITECLKSNPDPLRPDAETLECNDFCFDEKWYLQIKGAAMGKRFCPAYDKIYMAKWENLGSLESLPIRF